ncbi:hypothetical protein OGAPHI_000764 [Ogataea philodendri]|uniref:Uncharacterized protein n=1 Tax=Ogataea philodendri TaxID=1378263 RepID=A0A9P8PEZ0_9ASCO|nr:uncharacterized protein OGAPHI_000764 [Ogataea philodendri]KAH3671053.1 hypothetical protein OGAPHI_000764 [Ogataea philodendri]
MDYVIHKAGVAFGTGRKLLSCCEASKLEFDPEPDPEAISPDSPVWVGCLENEATGADATGAAGLASSWHGVQSPRGALSVCILLGWNGIGGAVSRLVRWHHGVSGRHSTGIVTKNGSVNHRGGLAVLSRRWLELSACLARHVALEIAIVVVSLMTIHSREHGQEGRSVAGSEDPAKEDLVVVPVAEHRSETMIRCSILDLEQQAEQVEQAGQVAQRTAVVGIVDIAAGTEPVEQPVAVAGIAGTAEPAGPVESAELAAGSTAVPLVAVAGSHAVENKY